MFGSYEIPPKHPLPLYIGILSNIVKETDVLSQCQLKCMVRSLDGGNIITHGKLSGVPLNI